MRATAIALVLIVAACTPSVQVGSPTPIPAMAVIRSTTGDSLGVLSVEAVSAGVRISGSLRGLPAGPHGIHLHTTGRCDAPDFATAGGHLNPTAAHHGLENPTGPHAGDMRGISADAGGMAAVDETTGRVTWAQLMDADGTAIVIHATADDQKTDPAGNSGARVACGVVRG